MTHDLLAGVCAGNSVLRGIASAMNTLCGQSYGAGAYDAVGVMWQRALAIVGLTALPIITLWVFAEPLLVHMGQEPRLAAMTAAYLWCVERFYLRTVILLYFSLV
jgi:multidrug resistance protein, MATE family